MHGPWLGRLGGALPALLGALDKALHTHAAAAAEEREAAAAGAAAVEAAERAAANAPVRADANATLHRFVRIDSRGEGVITCPALISAVVVAVAQALWLCGHGLGGSHAQLLQLLLSASVRKERAAERAANASAGGNAGKRHLAIPSGCCDGLGG